MTSNGSRASSREVGGRPWLRAPSRAPLCDAQPKTRQHRPAHTPQPVRTPDAGLQPSLQQQVGSAKPDPRGGGVMDYRLVNCSFSRTQLTLRERLGPGVAAPRSTTVVSRHALSP